MGPQDHLEVGVKARRQLYVLNRLEKRHQIEESSVWTFSSTDATVVNDSYAVVAVVIVIVVVVGCSGVAVWDELVVCAAVVVGIGAGARARVAGATGSRTTHRSVIDTDKMRFNTMSGDERNIRYDTMITEHQLTRTIACTEDRRKCYKDKFCISGSQASRREIKAEQFNRKSFLIIVESHRVNAMKIKSGIEFCSNEVSNLSTSSFRLSGLPPRTIITVKLFLLSLQIDDIVSCKNSEKNLDSYYFVTLFDFLSLKNDVNLISKSNKQKNFF